MSTPYDPTAEHIRWRKVGESVTSPYTNTERKVVLIDPCECIKKLFDAAKSAMESVPPIDVFGEKRGKAMRAVRGVRRFGADVKAYEFGKTAEAVYGDRAPAKWRVATEEELRDFGLTTSEDLKIKSFDRNGDVIESAFKAQLYVPANENFCDPMPAALVFKGTTEMEDWLNNLKQGVNVHSDYYEMAIWLGKDVITNAKKPVVIVGHSLGGGLASACSQASGKDAWTFNSAGLHPKTLPNYKAKPQPTNIQAYRHEGEVLTAVQEPGWVARFAQVILPIAYLGPVLGSLVTRKLREMPAAVGQKHDIPCAHETWDAVARHNMANMLISFNTKLQQDEAELRALTGVQCKQPVIV